MKLNIGCGFNKLEGYVNVDQFPECSPDLLWNLEETPWPFVDNSVDELVAHHVLEHLGQETKVFFNIIKELYRLMRHDGVIRIAVPHPYHRTFLEDPTHVRAFTPTTFEMMNRATNLDWAARGVNVTMLALMLDISFVTTRSIQSYDPSWKKKLKNGVITLEEIREVAKTQLGVVKEYIFHLRADKSHLGLGEEIT
jgi:SAM-dependent methyltransferase